jgi:hypothetical protein
MNGRQMIGFNRTVKLRWLDETLDLFMAGQTESEISQGLRESLQDQLSVGSNAQRGSREKTITLLLKTWVRVPAGIREFRDEAILLLQNVRRTDRLPFHWGMTTVAYPFWRTVADVTGRLVRLQGSASAAQVQRRVREIHGEREAVSRSARYVLRAFADWGAIVDTERKGSYVPVAPIRITDPMLVTWLLEATLLASEADMMDFKALVNTPALFPFQLDRISPDNLTKSCRFDVVRQGGDSDLIFQRRDPKCSTRGRKSDRTPRASGQLF